MKKIVFDSDGLIKLVKSGIFNMIQQECFISEEVYEEAVISGKKGFHDDAHQIEQYIQEKRIKVKNAERIKDMHGLGKGEISALALFETIRADAIVSDDAKFLALLEQERIPFVVPTEVIVALVIHKHITEIQGVEALYKIKKLVRKENYESALLALGGKK